MSLIRFTAVLSFWLVCGLAIGADVGPPEQSKPAALPEAVPDLMKLRDQRFAEFKKAGSAGDAAGTLASAEQTLAIDRKLYRGAEASVPDRAKTVNAFRGRFCDSATFVADSWEQAVRFDEVIPLRIELVAVTGRQWGSEHWKTVNARVALKHTQLLRSLSAADRIALRETVRKDEEFWNHLRGKRFQAAQEAGEEARKIRQRILGEQHPDYGSHLLGLAELSQAMGNQDQAEALYLESMAILKRVYGDQHPDYAKGLNLLALFHQSRGSNGLAEPLLKQALAIRKAAFGEFDPAYAMSLANLAANYDDRAAYDDAERLYQQALAIQKAALGEQHPSYANTLNSLAALYLRMAHYSRAEPLFRQSLEIRKRILGEDHPDYAMSLNNLAELYRATEDLDRAEMLLRQSLEIQKVTSGEEHPDYATGLNNLAQLLELRHDHSNAQQLYQQANAIWKKSLGEQHPHYAQGLNNLAHCQKQLGDLSGAKLTYGHAIQIRKTTLGELHPDYALSLNDLAHVHHMSGDYSRAESLFRQALKIQNSGLGENHPSYAVKLGNLAGILSVTHRDQEAEPLFRQALSINVKHLEETASMLTERQQLTLSRSVQYSLESELSVLLRLKNQDELAAAAVYDWKGATLMRQRAARLLADEAELGPLFAELQSVTRLWAALVQVSSTPGQAGTRSAQLAALTEQKERVEAELSRKSATFRIANQKATLTDLRSTLPTDAALVDYFEFWKHTPSLARPGYFDAARTLVAFVIRPRRPARMFDLGPVEPVSTAVDAWRQSYGQSPESRQAGKQLRTILWQPLLEALGDAKTVIVSPDGVIGRIPFAALPGAAEGTYLIEDHRLTLVPVPQLIPELLKSKAPRKLKNELLLMGDIDYEHRPTDVVKPDAEPRKRRGRFDMAGSDTRAVTDGATWPQLAGAAAEVAFIKDLYQRLYDTSDDAIIDRRQALATEEQFREFAPQCHLLHLATHGFFSQADKPSALATSSTERSLGSEHFGDRQQTVRGYSPGLLSGIVFAGANHPPEIPKDPLSTAVLPDDGILTADEIAFLPLNGVRLVVLSACETGLGEVAGGEGMLGIQRAFQVSGARTTLSSLWQVDDVVTRRLMEEFYRNYLEKELPAIDSLREAQLWLLRNPDQLRGDLRKVKADKSLRNVSPPFYWAAFTLSGDWR